MARHEMKYWLITVGVFLITSTLTLFFWQQQVRNQHLLLSQRTEDVCVQAGRRLEMFMETNLRMASIFATRWATHESRDFSQTRFEEFNSILLKELPGYYAVGLIPPDLKAGWLVSRDASISQFVLPDEYHALLEQARRSNRAVLSPPFEFQKNAAAVYAVLPLRRGNELLGYLVVNLSAEDLINDCFHLGIRSRYHFIIREDEHEIFRSSPEATAEEFERAPTKASVNLPIRNRIWSMDMVPREEMSNAYKWSSSLPLPLFGILISVGLSWLVYLLLRRVDMFRSARDQQVLLARKALRAQEEERARISRELHDELGQLLTALRLEMGWLETNTAQPGNDKTEIVNNVVSLVDQATRELRRMCKGLRPPLLDDLGLEPAVKLLMSEFKALSGMDVKLDLKLNDKGSAVTEEIALCTYRILQESLTNINRHAHATKVDIRLTVTPDELALSILDNGKGFDTNGLGELRGWGLEGMRERASLAGGKLRIRSAAGQGTEIRFRVLLDTRSPKEKP